MPQGARASARRPVKFTSILRNVADTRGESWGTDILRFHLREYVTYSDDELAASDRGCAGAVLAQRARCAGRAASVIRLCRGGLDGGIPHFHPHDLRHRYASVKIAEGVPVTQLAAQLGHARNSLTLDVRGHVLTR